MKYHLYINLFKTIEGGERVFKSTSLSSYAEINAFCNGVVILPIVFCIFCFISLVITPRNYRKYTVTVKILEQIKIFL